MEPSTVSKHWKKANVTAIFIKSLRHGPGDYRPVSFTSHICKVLESIDAILNHLKKFNLINRSQHGFVKKQALLTNLLEFLVVVVNYIDQGLPVNVIYLDFQKASQTFTQVDGTWD